MADVTKGWHAVFDKGSKQAQERLRKAHGNKPEFQAFLKSRGAEGGERSVKQASTSLKKATDTKVAAQKIADMRFKKALQASSERVKEMGRRRRESGEGLGGGLETARDVVAHVKKYGSIKAGRLGEEAVNETNGEYNRYGHIKPGSSDVDPTSFDKPSKVKPKMAKFKPMKKEEVETVEEANRIDLIKRAAASNRMGKSKFLSRVNARAAQLSQQKRDDKITKSTANYGMSNMPFNAEEVQMNEVSKSEAEKVLGGAVKEKPKMPPGKQPAGYRYVRGLARKAMKKGMMKEDVEVTEEIKDAADVGEYDYEGDMAKSQLRSILVNAKRMHDMLEENTNLPEWVQSKITLAQDYILTAASYMEGEMNEEFTDEEIAALTEAEMTAAQMKKREKYVKSMKPVSDWEKRYPGRGEQVLYATATKMAMKEEAEEVVEETEEQLEEKYMGFKALKASIAAKGGARDPGAVAAAIGRKKYGKEKFQAMAAAGKKANEETEVVTEAEGKVAVSPKEKTLAAMHGDKTKITYGDVIKARLQSAKEKALKGKE